MSNPFGSSSSDQPNLFAAASTVSPSGFGATQPVFGQTSVNASTSAGNVAVFGQTQPSRTGFGAGQFGQSSTIGASNTFGQSPSGSGSISTAFQQSPSVSGSNLFSQTATASGLSTFGQNAPAAQSNIIGGQTSAGIVVFGQMQATQPGQMLTGVSAQFTGATARGSSSPTPAHQPGTQIVQQQSKSDTGLFQQPSSNLPRGSISDTSHNRDLSSSGAFNLGQSGVGPNNPFGNVKHQVFGAAVKAENDKKTDLFGKGATESKSETNLFAKRKSDQGSMQSQMLFGKKIKPDPDVSTQMLKEEGAHESYSGDQRHVKSETLSSEQGSSGSPGLFKGRKINVQHPNPFGQADKFSATTDTSALFGKAKPSFQTGALFGKAMKSVKQADGQDAKASEVPSRNEDDINDNQSATGSSVGSTGSKRGAARGLFGKTAAPGRSAIATSGLFGKWVASGRPRLSSQQSQDGSGGDSSTPPARAVYKRTLSRDSSKEVAIVCKKVPNKYNNNNALREHFGQYGIVKKVFPNPSKAQATVHFETHVAAAEAKRRGLVLRKGVAPMAIFWSSYMSGGTPRATTRTGRGSSESDTRTVGSVKRRSEEGGLPKSKRTWTGDSDNIGDELQSMSGTADIQAATDHREVIPKVKVRDIPATLDRRTRSTSPTPSVSVLDPKTEKIAANMFQGMMARNTTERVQLLELRDKYIRQNRGKKKTDIETAQAFVGTCPDMCPEKERYDREDKRRLGYYEIIPGTENIPGRNPQVDHSRAVKEYARSSPDQDEPLPHELRPMPVLLCTMDYLLKDVANRGEDGRWGDWFDFLWNRTRGVRKDIIQQQLNDRNAVSLLEKCARFHVYCSERLCEEDMHSFDAKINNENLTKCLQSLREFYTDLEKKQHCYCENEAEFRAYTVLMNLNEGDILREVQQLRPEVRTSVPIKFAMQVYFALNNNNYIRFFRLLKQASFGNACIMHRYFTQVRNRAIYLMIRGYKMGSKSAQVSYKEIARLLAFESEDEASYFCQHYGLQVTGTEVILDRAEYIEPETAWTPTRSVSLIESKLLVSCGEFMNGNAFDPNAVDIQPASSFDANGKFYSHVELPARRGTDRDIQSTFRPDVRVKAEPVEYKPDAVRSRPEPVEFKPGQRLEIKQEAAPAMTEAQTEAVRALMKKLENEYVKEFAKQLFWDVIDEMLGELAQEEKSEIDAKLGYADDVADTMFVSVVFEEVKSLCEEVRNEEENLQQVAMRQELEDRRDRVADMVSNDIMLDLLDQDILNVATIQMREVKEQLRQESSDRMTAEINKDLAEEVLQDIVQEISEDVYDTDVTQRLEELEKFEGLVKLSRVSRFWQRWKKEYKAVVKIKRAMEEFPCAPNMANYSDTMDTMLQVEDRDKSIVNRMFYIGETAKITTESPIEIAQRRRETQTRIAVNILHQDLRYLSAWQPLDMAKVIGKQLNRRCTTERHGNTGKKKVQQMYWKLLLSLPDVAASGQSTVQSTGHSEYHEQVTKHLCQWLTTKFSKGGPPTLFQHTKSRVLSLYRCNVADRNMSDTKALPLRLGVCVRTLEGQLNSQDIEEVEDEMYLLGTNAIILVLPASDALNNRTSQRFGEFWSKQSKRLHSIFSIKPMCQKLPLVIVVPVSANQELRLKQLIDDISLDDLLQSNNLGSVDVVQVQMSEKLPKGIDVLDPKLGVQMCESLQWLAERCEPSPNLTTTYLRDFIDSALLKFYYAPMQENLKKRKQLGYLDQHPNGLLQLYCEVVEHMSKVVCDEQLLNVSWPVTEFTSSTLSALPPSHWNKGGHLDYVLAVVQSLYLPEFTPLKDYWESWSDVQCHLWSYTSAVVGDEHNGARIKLVSRLKNLLRKVELDFQDTCFLLEGEAKCEPTYMNVPWNAIISMCIDYKLDLIDFTDPRSYVNEANEWEEIKIAYDPTKLESFTPSPEWQHVESDKSILETPSLDTTVLVSVDKVRKDKEVPKAEISIIEDPSNQSVLKLNTKKSASSLITSIQAERRKSDRFQKYLDTVLIGGNAVEMNHDDDDRSMFTSVHERDNRSLFPSDRDGSTQSFTAGNNHSFDAGNFTVTENQRRASFDASGYFGRQSDNNMSGIFAHQPQHSHSQHSFMDASAFDFDSKRRKSDFGLKELYTLPGSKRRERLSEIFNNDKVMMYLKEPTLADEIENFKDDLRSSRRDSDLFEKRLRNMLENH